MLISQEGIGRLFQAVREIEPADVAGHIEQRLRDAVRAHLGDAAENEHIHQHGQDRLNQVPQRPEYRLLVLNDDIAPHEEPDQVPIAPNLPKIQMPQGRVGEDCEGTREGSSLLHW